MWNFLKSDKTESSLRVNLLLVTIPVSAILGAVAFHILYGTLHPIHTVWLGPGKIEYKVIEIAWSGIGLFVGAVIGAYFTLLYAKKINRDAENKTPPTP